MMSQVSVDEESVIKVDKPSLGPSNHLAIISNGVYESISDKKPVAKVRDSWSDITDILANTGYSNGEENKVPGRNKCSSVRLPSPLYNRNLAPYNSPASPTLYNTNSYPEKDNRDGCIQENKWVDNESRDADGEAVSPLEVEQARLEELVQMCCEYERQAQLERVGRQITQNRIKTNGSLTRDKRLPSTSPSPSPGLLHHHAQAFSFDSPLQGDAKSPGIDVRPPPSYENMIMLPGSPRPRIRTNPSKDGRDFNYENSENRIPLCLEIEHTPSQQSLVSSPYVNILPSMLASSSHNKSTANGGGNASSVEPEDVNVLRRDSHGSNGEEMSDERRASIAETNANNKYNFLGFDPRKNESSDRSENGIIEWGGANDSLKLEPLKAMLHSSPSWSSPTIDYDSYPDYDTVDDTTGGIIDQGSARGLSLPLDGRQATSSSTTSTIVESLRAERSALMKKLTALKTRVSDLELLQEEQTMREFDSNDINGGGGHVGSIVSNEVIQAERERLKEEELRVIQLKCKIQECDIEMEKCLAEQDASQKQFHVITDRSKHIIQVLDSKINSCDSEELKKELYDSLTQQLEFLDAEKKAHEDVEFRLLEEEASWLSRREDIQKEMSEALRLLHLRQERLARLESPRQHQLIDLQRVSHLKEIEQGRSRLKKVNQELERLTNQPVEPENFSNSPEDDVVRVRSGASVDDLDRISRVTSTTPIDMSCNSLGRKTIRSLQEIERNRHLHLAKQGSLVIQEERQRVEELKKRVQDEVRAQWAQTRFNHSLTSLPGSDHSSLEPARDSGLGSDEPDKRNSPDEDIKPLDSDLIEGKDGGESRPLSDASTCSEDTQVRLRSKSTNNLQRPLTRYLPIRGEGLDLRQHILEAGHQADLCPGLQLDSTSCRGFLLKLGCRWSRWNKRWFVFDRTKRCLAYFSDKSEKKIRGGAYFQAIEEVYVDHQNSVKSPNPKVTFVVKSVNRTFHLVAPSPEAMRIWVDVIFTGAEGYQQYSNH